MTLNSSNSYTWQPVSNCCLFILNFDWIISHIVVTYIQEQFQLEKRLPCQSISQVFGSFQCETLNKEKEKN